MRHARPDGIARTRTFAELRSAVEGIVHDALALAPPLRRVGISTTGSANAQDVVIGEASLLNDAALIGAAARATARRK